MTKKTTILITGGAGYIGSQLTALLLEKGYSVRVLDALLFGGRSVTGFLKTPGYTFIEGDIRNTTDIQKAIKGCDAVVHLAAIVGDPACAKNPALAEQVNKQASELLCSLALENSIKRFVFASTCSNYGKMSDPDGFVDESTSLNPVSLYAELKVNFENFLLSRNQTDFTPVCLRFATAYGLSRRPRFDLTLNEFTLELLMNHQLEIYGEQFWRPYCHTDDLAAACCMVLEADADIVSGQAFNVGDTNENYQKKTLAALILKQLPGKEKNIRFVKRDEDPRDYRVNFDKIKNTLPFRITKKVPDGITEIIEQVSSGKISDPDNPQYKNFYKE